MTESTKPWDDVSDEAIASLRETRLDLGDGFTKNAADLVLGWAQHVVRLKVEADGATPAELAWNAWDYVAALVLRELCEIHLVKSSNAGVDAMRVLAATDEVLRSFTEDDPRGVVRRFAADDAGTGWWWSRIPASGPIRTELDGWASRVRW